MDTAAIGTGENGHNVGRDVFRPQTWDVIGEALRLSPRELQIVQRVFDDSKESAIALELNISCSTVHSHLRRVYHKLRVSSRMELAIRVFEEFQRLMRVNA